MRLIVVVIVLAGCSTFATRGPRDEWQAYPGGPPPDCSARWRAPVIDAVVAVAATAAVVKAQQTECVGDPAEQGDKGACPFGKTAAMVVFSPVALGYAVSALVGASRNHRCSGARDEYRRANPAASGSP
jgi:hypothetical protein